MNLFWKHYIFRKPSKLQQMGETNEDSWSHRPSDVDRNLLTICMQQPVWVWAQPMRDDVTLYCCLSLAVSKPRVITVYFLWSLAKIIVITQAININVFKGKSTDQWASLQCINKVYQISPVQSYILFNKLCTCFDVLCFEWSDPERYDDWYQVQQNKKNTSHVHDSLNVLYVCWSGLKQDKI